MEQLLVIKIGGNIIDDEPRLASFLKDFAAIEGKKILVHGGGNLATKLAEQLAYSATNRGRQAESPMQKH